MTGHDSNSAVQCSGGRRVQRDDGQWTAPAASQPVNPHKNRRNKLPTESNTMQIADKLDNEICTRQDNTSTTDWDDPQFDCSIPPLAARSQSWNNFGLCLDEHWMRLGATHKRRILQQACSPFPLSMPQGVADRARMSGECEGVQRQQSRSD